MHFAKELTTPHDPSEAVLGGVRDAARRSPRPARRRSTRSCTAPRSPRTPSSSAGAPRPASSPRAASSTCSTSGASVATTSSTSGSSFPAPLVAARAPPRDRRARPLRRRRTAASSIWPRSSCRRRARAGPRDRGARRVPAPRVRQPRHEEQVRDRVRGAASWLAVSTSADVFPFAGEYERFTTTTINAYVQPMVDRYLGRLERGAGRGRLPRHALRHDARPAAR